VAEKNVFGLMYYDFHAGFEVGTYHTPSCNRCGYNTLAKIVSTNGAYSFTLNTAVGVDSSFDIDFLKLTLPPI
jgi:hypothetical protein